MSEPIRELYIEAKLASMYGIGLKCTESTSMYSCTLRQNQPQCMESALMYRSASMYRIGLNVQLYIEAKSASMYGIGLNVQNWPQCTDQPQYTAI